LGRYGKFKQDPNAFIFSLVNNDKKPIKIKNIRNAIICEPSLGPSFGENDILICSVKIVEISIPYL
jgi:hypothetical protein